MSPSLSPLDVCLCRFAFADKPEVSKVRPAVFLGEERGSLSVLLVKITSHAPRDDVQGEVVVTDLRAAGLLKESTIRCSQIIQATGDDVIKRLGRLSDRDAQSLLVALARLTSETDVP